MEASDRGSRQYAPVAQPLGAGRRRRPHSKRHDNCHVKDAIGGTTSRFSLSVLSIQQTTTGEAAHGGEQSEGQQTAEAREPGHNVRQVATASAGCLGDHL
jgi:hypothetical protein